MPSKSSKGKASFERKKTGQNKTGIKRKKSNSYQNIEPFDHKKQQTVMQIKVPDLPKFKKISTVLSPGLKIEDEDSTKKARKQSKSNPHVIGIFNSKD